MFTDILFQLFYNGYNVIISRLIKARVKYIPNPRTVYNIIYIQQIEEVI